MNKPCFYCGGPHLTPDPMDREHAWISCIEYLASRIEELDRRTTGDVKVG